MKSTVACGVPVPWQGSLYIKAKGACIKDRKGKGLVREGLEDWQFESNVTYAWEGFDAKKREIWKGGPIWVQSPDLRLRTWIGG
ncbi:hypothetical protein MTR_2g036870 [Medicago truncatula]|uniref:Uncharacterized protein n=1 Tax=Medicago truncatula TaxID=3880 RepID=G7IN23_MEDTR|nr:hypothetical protein MTR_2g036870 [Medicago truncatula]